MAALPDQHGRAADRSDDAGAPISTRLLAGYRPLPGLFDEMVDRDGRVRAHWQPLLAMLAALEPQEIERRFAAADRHLRDSGVFYRVYEDPGRRRAAVAAQPCAAADRGGRMARLAAGLVQRAELLEAVLGDVYGPARLVREGRLPAAVIAGNPEFLRPLVGVPPPGGAHLRFYAVDVGRSPDGHWWVLNDRTQAPSGAGYALENRLAALARHARRLSRAEVERLAPFFQALPGRADRRCPGATSSRVCVLTPGPMNETYFEHAYLARYLGFLLVEGEDLTVRDDGVFIRTVSGLRRAEVLLRRLDADFADPLELDGPLAPGRARPGAGGTRRHGGDRQCARLRLVEGRALLSFLPALAPAVLGARPCVAQCRDLVARASRARAPRSSIALDEMVIASAFLGELPGFGERREILGATLAPTERARMLRDDRSIAASISSPRRR